MINENQICHLFFEQATSTKTNHYLWLRSLSYLEYIGYRKMVKALGYDEVNRGVFHHLSDEIRHSFMLRELAEKKIQDTALSIEFSDELQLCAENYFQNLDQFIDDTVEEFQGEPNSFLCYLLVSYIIEKRAMKVYPQYLEYLSELDDKHIIQKIINDEKEHLHYLEKKLQLMPTNSLPAFQDIITFEQVHFVNYLENLSEQFESRASC